MTTEDDAIDFYLHVCAWGAGTMALPIARCVRPLHEPQAPEKLLRSHLRALEGDAVFAYRCLYSWTEDRIKHFGPAFFTKWLYFSAYDVRHNTRSRPPLILDRRVARSLGWATTGWRSETYGRYLDLAEEIRENWCPGQPLHVVEYALFKAGGAKKS